MHLVAKTFRMMLSKREKTRPTATNP
jgi:hypothetical protein